MAKAGPQVLPPVVAAIHNSDTWVRIGAVTILGQMANQSTTVLPALIDALSDHDGTVAGQAEIQFGRASEADAKSVVAQLRPLLKSSKPEACIAVLHALQYMGPKARDATPDLATLLKNDQTEVRSQAANTLRLIGADAKAAVESLHAALKDPDPDVRAQAAFALGTIDPRDPASMPVLIEALNSNGDDAWRAVEVVGAMGSDARDVAPILARYLAAGRDGSMPDTYSDARLRTTIAENLGKVWGSHAASALSDALAKDQDDDVRRAALASIGDLGAGGLGAMRGLILALRDENLGIREDASKVLAKLGTPAIGPLIASLHDPDLYMREGAVDALAQYKPLPDEAVRALTDTARKDQSGVVREAAANALVDANIPSGGALLATVQKEEDARQAAQH
jgi:HEAT repeat protein